MVLINDVQLDLEGQDENENLVLYEFGLLLTSSIEVVFH